MITGIILGICICVLIYAIGTQHWIGNVAGLALVIVGINSCADSEWYKADQREKAAQETQAAKLHIIREADGCKVYAFKSGERYHYFTKCGLATTTESIYNVSCGKNCSKTEVETIITENKK